MKRENLRGNTERENGKKGEEQKKRKKKEKKKETGATRWKESMRDGVMQVEQREERERKKKRGEEWRDVERYLAPKSERAKRGEIEI